MYLVDGVLKEYAWGRTDGLVPWHRPTGGPQAELWFGSHAGGPALLVEQPGRTLADLIAVDAGTTNGLRDLPLVKLLAAGRPLSIQVHPDAERAAAGFAAQQADPRLPILYSDDAEKFEVLIALSEFDTHVGWRDTERAAQVLIAAGLPEELHEIIRAPDRVGAMRILLELDESVSQQMIVGLIPAAVGAHWHPEEISALDRVATAFPGDRGVLLTVLLAHLRLHPGQALAVPAGVVHSYVEGLAVEVMTSSDNVLRFGLTPKTIAVDDALAAIRLDRESRLLTADLRIEPSDLPFIIEFVDPMHPVVAPAGVARIIVAINGDAIVDGVVVPEGKAGVLTSHDSEAHIECHGRAIVVARGVS